MILNPNVSFQEIKAILLNFDKGARIQKLPFILNYIALIGRNFFLAIKKIFLPIWPVPYKHFSDGMKTMHNDSFLDNEVFIRAYNRSLKSRGEVVPFSESIPWRIHQDLWAAKHCFSLDGDFVECGTGRGLTMSAVLESLTNWNSSGKSMWLFDTFGSESYDGEGKLTKNKTISYAKSIDKTKENFSEWNNIKLIEGFLPATLSQLTSEKIAFLHIDLNCAEPEVESLRELWDKLCLGAIVILDDYAWHGREAQYNAMNTLSEEIGFSILSTPTGQGIIIK